MYTLKNIHAVSPLAPRFPTHACPFAFSSPKVPFVCIDFCWNNETPWHWKVGFLLQQSCLRTVCCCCSCHGSLSTTGSVLNIAGNRRLESTLCTRWSICGRTGIMHRAGVRESQIMIVSYDSSAMRLTRYNILCYVFLGCYFNEEQYKIVPNLLKLLPF